MTEYMQRAKVLARKLEDCSDDFSDLLDAAVPNDERERYTEVLAKLYSCITAVYDIKRVHCV